MTVDTVPSFRVACNRSTPATALALGRGRGQRDLSPQSPHRGRSFTMNNPFSVRSTFDGTDAITTHQIRERVVAEATDAGADLLTRVTERATNNAIETIAALPRG